MRSLLLHMRVGNWGLIDLVLCYQLADAGGEIQTVRSGVIEVESEKRRMLERHMFLTLRRHRGTIEEHMIRDSRILMRKSLDSDR